MARLYPKKEQRFGYVFDGKDPKKDKKYFHGPHGTQESARQDLQDHQVYESIARAIRPIHGSSARNLF